MSAPTTALRLTGRDVLPLLHRTTSNALADLAAGSARATLFCDFRGRLQHRAVVAVAPDGAVWLLRADAPGAQLAAAVDRMVFRDDVQIEDCSEQLPMHAVLDASARVAAAFALASDGRPRPVRVSSGDGLALVAGEGDALAEAERIARLVPRHGHEIADAFTPYEVGLAHEVHLAKGCFTGQEALQRLITYDSVRRRLAFVRLAAPVTALPADVLHAGERAGVLTSAEGTQGLAVLAHAVATAGARLSLADGTALEVLVAPEPARPLGRP